MKTKNLTRRAIRVLVPSACLALGCATGILNAQIVLLDLSPDAYPTATLSYSDGSGGAWANGRVGQHFAESVSFPSSERLVGMGIYSSYMFGTVGQTVTVDLWQDSAGQPGALLNEFTEAITSVNTDGASTAPFITQKYAPFSSPVTLAANTVYWIGMSGGDVNDPYSELGQQSLSPATYGGQAQFDGDTYQGTPGIGDISMRLYVPDGGLTVTLLGMALSGLALIRRKL